MKYSRNGIAFEQNYVFIKSLNVYCYMSSSVKLISPETPTIYPTAVYIQHSFCILLVPRNRVSLHQVPNSLRNCRSYSTAPLNNERNRSASRQDFHPTYIQRKFLSLLYTLHKKCVFKDVAAFPVTVAQATHTHIHQKYIYIYIFKFTTHTHCVHLPTNSTICSNIEQRVATLYQKVLPKKKM